MHRDKGHNSCMQKTLKYERQSELGIICQVYRGKVSTMCFENEFVDQNLIYFIHVYRGLNFKTTSLTKQCQLKIKRNYRNQTEKKKTFIK